MGVGVTTRSAATVTVGMPVYNDAPYLRVSLDSVLAQTYRDFVLVISDDGSTDGSDVICLEYAERDERVRFVRQPRNLGISRNMEFLRDQAESPFFAWVGDDDVWHPRFLELLVARLQEEPGAVVAFGTYLLVDEDGAALGSERDFDYSGATRRDRLRRFLRDPDDCFGYGLLRRGAVERVTFPRWPWPNRRQAYNNIFPSLCHYLALGGYVHVGGEALYRKRVKGNEGKRHNRGSGSGTWELIRYATRRFYLVGYSGAVLARAGGLGLAAWAAPRLTWHWLVRPVAAEWSRAVAGRLSRVFRAARPGG